MSADSHLIFLAVPVLLSVSMIYSRLNCVLNDVGFLACHHYPVLKSLLCPFPQDSDLAPNSGHRLRTGTETRSSPLIHDDDVDMESLPMPVAPSHGGSRSPSLQNMSHAPVSTFQTQNEVCHVLPFMYLVPFSSDCKTSGLLLNSILWLKMNKWKYMLDVFFFGC